MREIRDRRPMFESQEESWFDDGGDRKVDRDGCDDFVPYAGDEQPNVSPTAAAQL